MKKITVYYSIGNGGDGSAYLDWYLTLEEVENDQEEMDEGQLRERKKENKEKREAISEEEKKGMTVVRKVKKEKGRMKKVHEENKDIKKQDIKEQ